MNEKIPPQEQVDEMAEFRKEVENKKLEEIKAGYPIHLFDVHANELIDIDREMWEKLKNNSITLDDVKRHRESIWGKHAPQSRVNFGGYIANVAEFVIFPEKEEKK